MARPVLDLSRRRFHPGWVLLGAVIGRSLGLVGGMNFAFWYFADPTALLWWQILGTVVGALFLPLAMTSSATLHTKGAILGLGAGFGVAAYGVEIWAYLLPSEGSAGLAGITVAQGIFVEWIMTHGAWLGLVIGWVVGAAIHRRRKGAPPQVEAKEEVEESA